MHERISNFEFLIEFSSSPTLSLASFAWFFSPLNPDLLHLLS